MRCVSSMAGTTPASIDPFETLTNVFLDGLTKDDDDAELFSHLARCAACRCRLNSLVEFRRLIRGERFEVPLWTDRELFHQIERQRARSVRTHRARRVDHVRTLARVGSAALAIAMSAILIGVLMPRDDISFGSVSASQEVVEFETTLPPAAPVYVFYPGLVIEDSR